MIKKFFISFLCFSTFLSISFLPYNGYAENQDLANLETQELVALAWQAAGKQKFDELQGIIDVILDSYQFHAERLHLDLKNFPPRDQIEQYQVLNDVATILFIEAESMMHRGQQEKAIAAFENLIEKYPYSQAWDPSRGSYWSIAEKSEASINVMKGIEPVKKVKETKKTMRTTVKMHKPGKDKIVDYTKYGEFSNVGTMEYKYTVKNAKGLSKAVGEGIFPNTSAVLKNPNYRKAYQEGRLEGSHWDYVQSEDLEAAFYKWATAPEPWGVRLFYIGMILEKSKMYVEAIKAYHALVVHFPNAIAWTYWQTPWYPAQAAIGKIKHIVREHPELNLRFKWANIRIVNGTDNDPSNDVVITYPGMVEEVTVLDKAKQTLGLESGQVKLEGVKRRLGEGKVQLVQYENDHWQMLVENKPYIIKGITYTATKVGQSPDKGTLANWMEEDLNRNGLPDGPYDSWVDKNQNNIQDPDEKVVGDFQLLKEMGANTLRIYHHPDTPNKKVLRKMHEEFGFKVIMGDFLGKYTLGSGADWFEGTDYENEEHKISMIESVRQMVEEHKKEPYILFWLLGNENNYGVASNADKKPEAYFTFANEVAKMIKSIDPDHPVALCNGDTLFLDEFAEYAPDIDIFSANVYRGDFGFGAFWSQVADAADKPTFISEYGAPAYASSMSIKEAEAAQAAYHRGNWYDIWENSAGFEDGVGNSIGGVAFEWMDEWWKNYEPAVHDTAADVIGPFPGGYYFEEWFGLIGQGDGKNSPFLRQPREVYYTYRELWNVNK